jgi:hypothetical protein
MSSVKQFTLPAAYGTFQARYENLTSQYHEGIFDSFKSYGV